MKKKVIATTLVTVVLVAGILFTVNGCADKNTDSSQTAKTETSATITDADTTEKESVDVADADKDTDDSETVKADAAKTGKTKDDSDKEPATQTPATTEAPTTQAPAPSTEAPATTEAPAPRTEEPTTAHQHTWKTVVDKDEWDEPIYEEQDVYENHSYWPDGTLADDLLDPCAKARWCGQHCVSCFPNCPDPDPAGRCAFSITDGEVWVGTEKVQTGTKHHAAVTHQECSTCGARK
uniref:hypothetical protein n=1 Tax=Coprococcus sp. TaxID=2049024 RepID=UPI003FEEB34B